MWPWEHVAVAYLAYSLWLRARGLAPPARADLVAVAFGALFPDLLDKPLGWGTELLPAGRSLAHSLLFAVPISLLVLVVAWRANRVRVGAAFALGYLLHLPSDVASNVMFGGRVRAGFLLWPLVAAEPASTSSLFANLETPVRVLLGRLGTPAGRWYLLLEVTLLGSALAAWWWDGRPGLASRDRTRD